MKRLNPGSYNLKRLITSLVNEWLIGTMVHEVFSGLILKTEVQTWHRSAELPWLRGGVGFLQ